MAAVDDVSRQFARVPLLLVELVVVGTITGTVTFRFSLKGGPALALEFDEDIRPYLLSFPGRTTRLRPDKALTERPRLTLNFRDDPDAPDFPSANFTITKGGTFFKRLLVAQPDLRGSDVDIKIGFAEASLTLSDFRTIFQGRVEDFDLQANGNFQIIIKDRFPFLDRQVPSEISDTNLLDGAITASATTITVDDGNEVADPGGLPFRDLYPITIRLSKDVVEIDEFATGANEIILDTAEGDQTALFPANETFTASGASNDNNNASYTVSSSTFSGGKTVITVTSGPLANETGSPAQATVDNEEDVILTSKSGNVLTVQDNYLDKSEKFDDAAWVKTGGTTVSVNNNVGPFGGDPAADLLTFPITPSEIKQTSALPAAGENAVFSVWIRRPFDETADGTITLDIFRSDGTELTSKQQTFTNRWQRFVVSTLFAAGGAQTISVRIVRDVGDAEKVLVFGAQLEKGRSVRRFYASTDGNEGADAGRGAFGTSPAAHKDNLVFKEVLNYSEIRDKTKGVHPIFALRDLINRAEILPERVDEVLFADQFDFLPGTQILRAGNTAIQKPARLNVTIKELRKEAFLDFWISETGLARTRWGFVVVRPGETPPKYSDEENLVLDSVSYKGNATSRVTRMFVYYDLKTDAEGNKAEDFNKVQVFAELGVESASGSKSQSIFSKWIFRAAEALETAGRIVGRFKRGARILKFSLDLKDEPDFDVGDLVSVNSTDLLIPGTGGSSDTAVRGETIWQVTRRTHKRLRGLVDVEVLEAVGRKVGFISPDDDLETAPDDFPDFPDASVAERQYGFIGDVDNLVNVGTEDGYYIL